MRKILKPVEFTAEEKLAVAAAGEAITRLAVEFQRLNGSSLHATCCFKYSYNFDRPIDAPLIREPATWGVLSLEGPDYGSSSGKDVDVAMRYLCLGADAEEKLAQARKYREAAEKLGEEAKGKVAT